MTEPKSNNVHIEMKDMAEESQSPIASPQDEVNTPPSIEGNSAQSSSENLAQPIPNEANDDGDSMSNEMPPIVPQYSVAARLRSTVKHLFYNTINNAPLLRFVNSSNRYNRLDEVGHPIGESNDGVFSNMSAKPTVGESSGSIGDLPTYDEAVQDPAPPYWESSIMSGFEDEVFVDGLPVGNIVSFIWNMTVSICFEFIGFVITYLLHTSHASKNGSQAGLGVTLFMFGWTIRPPSIHSAISEIGGGQKFEPENPSSVDIDDSMVLRGSLDGYQSDLLSASTASPSSDPASSGTSNALYSYSLMAIGVFICVKGFYDFWRVRRKEYYITRPATTAV